MRMISVGFLLFFVSAAFAQDEFSESGQGNSGDTFKDIVWRNVEPARTMLRVTDLEYMHADGFDEDVLPVAEELLDPESEVRFETIAEDLNRRNIEFDFSPKEDADWTKCGRVFREEKRIRLYRAHCDEDMSSDKAMQTRLIIEVLEFYIDEYSASIIGQAIVEGHEELGAPQGEITGIYEITRGDETTYLYIGEDLRPRLEGPNPFRVGYTEPLQFAGGIYRTISNEVREESFRVRDGSRRSGYVEWSTPSGEVVGRTPRYVANYRNEVARGTYNLDIRFDDSNRVDRLGSLLISERYPHSLVPIASDSEMKHFRYRTSARILARPVRTTDPVYPKLQLFTLLSGTSPVDAELLPWIARIQPDQITEILRRMATSEAQLPDSLAALAGRIEADNAGGNEILLRLAMRWQQEDLFMEALARVTEPGVIDNLLAESFELGESAILSALAARRPSAAAVFTLAKGVIESGDLEAMQLILDLELDLSGAQEIDGRQTNLLMLVLYHQNVDMYGQLRRHGVDLNSGPDMTPLHFALETANVSAATLLIEDGADVEATDASGNTPLAALAMRPFDGSAAIIDLLLEHGADVNARVQHSELGPISILHLGAISNNTALVERFLGGDFELDLEGVDTEGDNIVHAMVNSRMYAQLEMLWELGDHLDLFLAEGKKGHTIFYRLARSELPSHSRFEAQAQLFDKLLNARNEDEERLFDINESDGNYNLLDIYDYKIDRIEYCSRFRNYDGETQWAITVRDYYHNRKRVWSEQRRTLQSLGAARTGRIPAEYEVPQPKYCGYQGDPIWPRRHNSHRRSPMEFKSDALPIVKGTRISYRLNPAET